MRTVALRNPRAGRHRRSGDLARHLRLVGELVETGSLDELDGASREIARAAPDLVVVCGGDGTVAATLTALAAAHDGRPLPRVCVLPLGTMNIIAGALGGRGAGEAQLARLRSAIADGRPLAEKPRTTIAIDAADGRRDVGLLFGMGLFARFLEVYEAERGRGPRRAATLLARSILGSLVGGGLVSRLFAPFEARVTVDGARWPGTRWTNVSAGGVESLGFGFAPYPRAAERPGAFHLVAHDLDARGALVELPRLRLGRGMKRVTQGLARHVTVETERPIAWAVDGELRPPTARLELAAGPVVRFVVP